MSCFCVHVLSSSGEDIQFLGTDKRRLEKQNQWSIWEGLWIHMWNFEKCGSFVLSAVVMTSALENGGRSSRVCYAGLWEQQTRSALWLPALSSLFSRLSSPGGFFIWIVTVSNGFVEVLVSCWFSLLPYSFRHNNLCTPLRESQHKYICIQYICTKMQLCSAAAGGMHVSFTVAAIQNDISSERLPWSIHAMFVYTWITHHSSCLFTTSMTTVPTVEPVNTGYVYCTQNRTVYLRYYYLKYEDKGRTTDAA